MYLSLAQANHLLTKLGLPTLRPATPFEQRLDMYGVRQRWVIDRGPHQALHAYPTIERALVAILQTTYEPLDVRPLTLRERAALRHVQRQCSDRLF